MTHHTFQAKTSSASYNLEEELESLSLEKLKHFLSNLQNIVKDCVVDINNEAKSIHAVLQVIETLIKKDLASSQIVSLVAPILG